MSRLNGSNDKRLTFRWLRPGAPGVAGVIGAFAALRYRIPSSPMPWSALGEPHRGQPAPPNQAELGEGVDGVLTTGRNEAACRRAEWRHHVAVQLYQENQAANQPAGGCPAGIPDGTAGPCRETHRSIPADSNAHRNPRRSCCSNRADETCRLLGSARITT